MLHDLVSAAYKGGYLVELTFDNGEHGVVDFTSYLQRGGVFKRFHDVSFFRENQQPKGNCCGSFFKNPSRDISAGMLIESV